MLEQKGQSEAASPDAAAILEKVIVGGDLSKLSTAERMAYYSRVCESLSLNPLTQPFAYVTLRGRGLTLYALKAATDQLRKVHGVSITRLDVAYQDDLVVVTVTAQDRSGRTDTDVGVVALGKLGGEDRANAVLKSVTKAKRRVTLSICGLGMLDETEVEAIAGAEVCLEDAPGAGKLAQGEGGAPAATRPTARALPPQSGAGEQSGNAAQLTREQLAAQIRHMAGVTLTELVHWQDLARTYGTAVPSKWKDMTQPSLLALLQAMVARGWDERILLAATEQEITDARSGALADRDKRRITSEQYTRLYDAAEARYAELSGPLTAQAV